MQFYIVLPPACWLQNNLLFPHMNRCFLEHDFLMKHNLIHTGLVFGLRKLILISDIIPSILLVFCFLSTEEEHCVWDKIILCIVSVCLRLCQVF